MAPDTGELAVIALGKLGGYELNYASDVDLLFLHRDPGPRLRKLPASSVAAVTAMLAEPTAEGIALRVDRSAAGRPSRCPEPFTRGHPRLLRPGVRHVGTPSDDQGAAGRRRCGPRTRVRRGRDAVRLPARARTGHHRGRPADEGAARGVHPARGKEFTEVKRGRAASATSSSRCSCCRSCTGAVMSNCAPPTRSLLSDRWRWRDTWPTRTPRSWPTPTGSCGAWSTVCRSCGTCRHTTCPPAGTRARPRTLARTPGRRRPHRRVRSDDRTGPIDPRAAVLPAAPRVVRRACAAASGSRHRPTGHRGAAGRARLRRTRPFLRRAGPSRRSDEAHREGARPPVPGDGARPRALADTRRGPRAAGTHRRGGRRRACSGRPPPTDPVAARRLAHVAGASSFATDLLVADPSRIQGLSDTLLEERPMPPATSSTPSRARPGVSSRRASPARH